MNRSFNAWWLLPIITGLIGIIVAIVFNPTTESRVVKHKPAVNHVVASPAVLSVTHIALPPEPIVKEPVLTATINNNKVELRNDDVAQNAVGETVAAVQNTKELNNDFNASELASQFSQIMQDMANEAENETEPVETLHAQPLTQHPQWYQDLVPELEFSSHIYASDKNERWVRVNNQVVQEGELITATMRLISIEPQQVIIEMHERKFTLPALTSW